MIKIKPSLLLFSTVSTGLFGPHTTSDAFAGQRSLALVSSKLASMRQPPSSAMRALSSGNNHKNDGPFKSRPPADLGAGSPDDFQPQSAENVVPFFLRFADEPEIPVENGVTEHASEGDLDQQEALADAPQAEGLASDEIVPKPALTGAAIAKLEKKGGGEFEKIDPPVGLNYVQSAFRMVIKNILYHQVALSMAFHALFGKQTPYVNFKVGNEFPAIFLNFKIKPERLQDFHKALGVPENVTLAPVSVAEGEPKAYTLTGNIYEVKGITQGLRAEWSTYMDRGDGKPSYLMVAAHTDKHSMDPDGIVTHPVENFSYLNNGTHWLIGLDTPDGVLNASFSMDDMRQGAEVLPDREWIGSNDRVYWRKYMIYDRVFCDSSAYAEKMKVLNATVDDSDRPMNFLKYTEEKPISAYALKNEANFVVAPWYNMNAGTMIKIDWPNLWNHVKEEVQKMVGGNHEPFDHK